MIERIAPALPEHAGNGNGHLPEAAGELRLAAADPAQLMLFARQALENARTIPEVREAAARGEALKVYFRDSRRGVVWENEAAAYRLECLRKAGRLVAEETGGQTDSTAPQASDQSDSAVFRTLKELNVSKYESSRWQDMAAVPDGEFLRWVEENRERERGVSASGLLSLERALRYSREGGLRTQAPAGDHFQTPADDAMPMLLPFLRPGWRIWEPAQGKGNITRWLEARGFHVIGSDLLDGRDFLTWEPDEPFDCIITNSPGTLKDDFLLRCFRFHAERGTPFALLGRITTGGEQERTAMFREHGIDIISPDRRFNYEPPSGEGSGSHFFSQWFTRGLNLPPEPSGRIYYWTPEGGIAPPPAGSAPP